MRARNRQFQGWDSEIGLHGISDRKFSCLYFAIGGQKFECSDGKHCPIYLMS